MSKIYHSYKKPAFSATSKERLEMSEDLYNILTPILNKIHETSYSKRFWKILIAPYVSFIINNKSLFEKEDIGLSISDFDNISIKLKSKFINYNSIRYYFKTIGSNRKLIELKNQIKSNDNIALGFHNSQEIEEEIGIYIHSYNPKIKNFNIDYLKRDVNFISVENYSDFFINNIIKLIPKLYLESFNYFMEIVPLIKPSNKKIHLSFIENIFMRYLVALYVENGSQLFYYQHGAFYGEYKYHNSHHYESSIADNFMTWGWKIKRNDYPNRAFRLENFSKNHNKFFKKKFDLLLIYPIIDNTNRNYHLEKSKLFFDKLNRRKFKRICARPRPKSKFRTNSDLNFIAHNVDKIKFGYVKISNLISSSKLIVIMNAPSTTLLECLYVDHPVVALLNNDCPSDIIKPHYDNLLNMKLFHLTMSSLIEHINKSNIDEWWNELKKHKSYLNFKNEFLRKV